ATAAAVLLDDFVRRAAERGLPPHPLAARTFDGRSTYRTHVRGWYLKSNRSVAVGADGEYYVLTVPASLRARFTGADLTPSTPRPVPPPDNPVNSAVGGDALATHGLVVPAGAPRPPAVTATTWLVADLDTGEVLGACGPHVYQTPASVQKTLLAATVIDEL